MKARKAGRSFYTLHPEPCWQPMEWSRTSLSFKAMNEMCCPNFEGPGILSMWPFLDAEGAAVFVYQGHPSENLEAKVFPALQRTAASRRRLADFSIRSILALDGSEGERKQPVEPGPGVVEWCGTACHYPWTSCSPLNPAFVPKTKQATSSPRPASHSPRVPFSATQLGTLENSFQQARYLSSGQVREVALLLGLPESRVKIWFQNRRARDRRDLLKQQLNRSFDVKGNPLQPQSSLGWD